MVNTKMGLASDILNTRGISILNSFGNEIETLKSQKRVLIKIELPHIIIDKLIEKDVNNESIIRPLSFDDLNRMGYTLISLKVGTNRWYSGQAVLYRFCKINKVPHMAKPLGQVPSYHFLYFDNGKKLLILKGRNADPTGVLTISTR